MSALGALLAAAPPVSEEWFEAELTPDAGRIAYLVVAGGAVLWTLLYGVLGVLTGNLTDSPLVAAAMAVGLVAVVGAVTALVGRLRTRLRDRRARVAGDPAGTAAER